MAVDPKTAIADANSIKPLELLEGRQLIRGWSIQGRIRRSDDQTGGRFSVGYECKHDDGRKAFLKAIDLSEALQQADPIAALGFLADAVQCEVELLQTARRMDRVVTLLDYDFIRDLKGVPLAIPIPYIVFERADGNARSVVRASARPPHSWCMSTLQQVATGMSQLHRQAIAHGDLKSSNVLLFGSKGAKISDLGRSIRQGRNVWYENADWAGDRAYAPPEVVYGFAHPEFNVRRLAADLFLLGSFATTLLCSATMNALIFDQLPQDFRPAILGGSYTGTFEQALPHLRTAFQAALDSVAQELPFDAPYRSNLMRMISQWCDPDPRDRGHPNTRALYAGGGNIYELERYLASLANEAARARSYEGRRSKP